MAVERRPLTKDNTPCINPRIRKVGSGDDARWWATQECQTVWAFKPEDVW
jgi:hypothetical protein